jgi:hypothetical protein
MRWSTGAATVERPLAAGHIERVQGALKTAAEIIDAAAKLVPNLGFF